MEGTPLTEDEKRAFRQLKAQYRGGPLLVMADFARRTSDTVRASTQSFYEMPVGWRVVSALAIVGLGATVAGLGISIYTDNQKAAARRAAIEQALDDPEIRTELGTCNADLQREAQVARARGRTTQATLLDKAAAQPGSDQVPCAPDSYDGAVTMTFDGVEITITERDLLPYTFGTVPVPSPS